MKDWAKYDQEHAEEIKELRCEIRDCEERDANRRWRQAHPRDSYVEFVRYLNRQDKKPNKNYGGYGDLDDLRCPDFSDLC